MLEIAGLSKHFDGVQAVTDVTFSVDRSAITSLIGPNGAGKTTLFNMICGYHVPNSGAILFNNREITGKPPPCRSRCRDWPHLPKPPHHQEALHPRQRHARLQPRRVPLRFPKKGKERQNRERAQELLAFVGLSDKAEEPAGELSYGQQKLLNLACCRALGPALLLLDEPVAGVNQEMTVKILGLLRDMRDEGIGVLVIEHNMEAVMEISDRLIVMAGGRVIADGEPAQVMENPERESNRRHIPGVSTN